MGKPLDCNVCHVDLGNDVLARGVHTFEDGRDRVVATFCNDCCPRCN